MGGTEDTDRLARARAALARAEERAGLRPEARIVEDALTPSSRPPSRTATPDAILPSSEGITGHVLQVGGGTGPLLRAAASLGGPRTWWGVVALPDTGWLAASRAGMTLDHVLCVPRPGPLVGEVLAALLDGVDVLCLGDVEVPSAQRRRLAARLRRDGGTLLSARPWPGISHPWGPAVPVRHLEAV